MSETADPMAPEASPGAPGVRRVNNVPMYLLASVIALFLIVMALVAVDRAAQQNAPADGLSEPAGNTAIFAYEIAGDMIGGIIEPVNALVPPVMSDEPEPNPATPEVEPVLMARLDQPDAPPWDGQYLDPPDGGVYKDNADRIRMAKMQMLEEAIKAKTTVQVIAPRSSGSAPSGTAPPQTRDEMIARLAAIQAQIDAQRADNPTAAYQARLAQFRSSGAGASGGMPSSGAPALLQTSASGGGNSYAQFAGNGGDRWKLDSQPEAPRSPFELRAGFVVPATLISGINSQLPGQIMAQVSQHVYDTPTGHHLLIPQGSRLVGMYSSEVAYGQSRVLIAWQRIVFPDGKAMDIGSMPGGDAAGYAGLKDRVNNHYFRVFASAFLMSGVIAGIATSQDYGRNSVNFRPTASSAMSEALGQQIGQVTAQMVAKHLNIAPTLEIRPGYRFNVIVTRDMNFSKPYRSFDY